ncbi:hypothetical protein EV174_000473 [Coemansia sp. RSA 2320]|nr:hypothetical protein EV174_000473 [Coemansia sp. RSA 2320]
MTAFRENPNNEIIFIHGRAGCHQFWHVATHRVSDGRVAAALKQQADSAKARLVAALTAKCRALDSLATQTLVANLSTAASDASGEFVDIEAEEEGGSIEKLERAVAELARWTDKKAQADNIEYLVASLPLLVAKQHYGKALQPVLKWLASAPLQKSNAAERKTMAELRDLLLAKLQWSLWTGHFRELALVESPSVYEAL